MYFSFFYLKHNFQYFLCMILNCISNFKYASLQTQNV